MLCGSTLITEADTCRKYVVPKLIAAGWDNEPHSIAEQRTITDGRIVPVGKGFVRQPPTPPAIPTAAWINKPMRPTGEEGAEMT